MLGLLKEPIRNWAKEIEVEKGSLGFISINHNALFFQPIKPITTKVKYSIAAVSYTHLTLPTILLV